MRSWVRHLYDPGIAAFIGQTAQRREPIEMPAAPPRYILGNRAAATYAAHPYWSKKPHELLLACISTFTRPGDLVLDPCAGSGGLPLLAARQGRAAIALDRSPAAAFVTDSLSQIPAGMDVRAAIGKALALSKIATLFLTACHRCGGPASTQYAVWHDVAVCDTRRRARSAIGAELQEIEAACISGCRPKRFRRRAESGEPAAAYWRAWDVPSALRHRRGPVDAPRTPFPAGAKTGELFARGIYRVDQMFTSRNLRAMATVRAAIDEFREPGGIAARLAWHAALLGTSLKAQHVAGGGGYLPGMYYVPRVRKERNPVVTLNRVASRLASAMAAYDAMGPVGPMLTGIADARDLSAVPAASVDYVFLDPPYDAKVQYAELNLLWESWLGADDDWRDADLAVKDARLPSRAAWHEGMRQVLGECARILKPGAWLTLTCVPSLRVSLSPVIAHAASVGMHHNAGMDGTVVNRQRTFNQRKGRSPSQDRVMNFQRARC